MDSLFPFLVAQVWQVALLAVVVWIVVKPFCKRRPHLAHALWLLVLIKCLVPPVFSSSAGIYSWLLKDEKPIPATIVDERGQLPTKSSDPAFVEGLFSNDSQKQIANSDPTVSFNLTPSRKPQVVQTPTKSRVAKAFEAPTTKVNRSSRVPQVAPAPVARKMRESKQAKTTPFAGRGFGIC